MAGVLLTGFEPFDGETVNPSWEVVKQLDGTMIAGQPVIARQLPVCLARRCRCFTRR
jgi:pyroglutamyl-peptidase